MKQNKISKETFELSKIYSLCSNAKLRTEVLMKSKNVEGQAKDYLRRSIFNRLNAIENDLKALFIEHPKDLEVIKEEMINEENSLQNENVQNLFLALPKGIRDEIERYIEQRHFIYTNN